MKVVNDEEIKRGIEKALIGYGGDVLGINKKYPIIEHTADRLYAFHIAREKRLNEIYQLFEQTAKSRGAK